MPQQQISFLFPTQSVNYVLGSNKAYVVVNGVVEAREVKLGDRFEREIEIIEGLQQGEEVADAGYLRILQKPQSDPIPSEHGTV